MSLKQKQTYIVDFKKYHVYAGKSQLLHCELCFENKYMTYIYLGEM